jgi:class 3 adenylate cyclase
MEALGREHRKVTLEKERLDKIKNVMAHFVPDTAKNIIEEDPEKAHLKKYRRDATVLFLDIEGFTTLMQRYPTDRINHVIEIYFSSFYDIIQKRGGDINETAGDGMMVIFLAQNSRIHAENAVRAAMEIQEKCLELPAQEGADLFPVQINIGISSGDVYLGSTKMKGSGGDRWTFTASGPVTILAARLCQYARGGLTLVGEETARRVAETFQIVSVGRVPLKNLDDSGEVFEVKK